MLVVEELRDGHVEHRLLSAVEEDLDVGLGERREEGPDEDAVDAARAVRVEEYVPAVLLDALEIRVVGVTARPVPGAGHRRVGVLELREIVDGSEPLQKPAEIAAANRAGNRSRSKEAGTQKENRQKTNAAGAELPRPARGNPP